MSIQGMTAAILVGGLGKRLRPVVADRPKPLAPVGNRPFLTYLLDQLDSVGIEKVVLLSGYRAGLVRSTLGTRYRNIRLKYSEETQPLGTAGALHFALAEFGPGDLLLLNGDSYCDVDLQRFIEAHSTSGLEGSLVVTPVEDVSRFGCVLLNEAGLVIGFAEKSRLPTPGLINAGIYLLSQSLLEEIPEGTGSLEREHLPRWALAGRLQGYCHRGAFLDIGTPESYALGEEFVGAFAR